MTSELKTKLIELQKTTVLLILDLIIELRLELQKNYDPRLETRIEQLVKLRDALIDDMATGESK